MDNDKFPSSMLDDDCEKAVAGIETSETVSFDDEEPVRVFINPKWLNPSEADDMPNCTPPTCIPDHWRNKATALANSEYTENSGRQAVMMLAILLRAKPDAAPTVNAWTSADALDAARYRWLRDNASPKFVDDVNLSIPAPKIDTSGERVDAIKPFGYIVRSTIHGSKHYQVFRQRVFKSEHDQEQCYRQWMEYYEKYHTLTPNINGVRWEVTKHTVHEVAQSANDSDKPKLTAAALDATRLD